MRINNADYVHTLPAQAEDQAFHSHEFSIRVHHVDDVGYTKISAARITLSSELTEEEREAIHNELGRKLDDFFRIER